MGFFLIFASACEEIETPFPEFDELEYGAFPRLLSGPTGEFNFFNPAGSSVSFTVEFYDENKGKNVSSYSWTVSYIDRTNNGANNKPAAALVTIPASSFGTSPDGLPSATVTFTLQQVFDALGLTINDVNGGDTFEFQGTITKTDGSTFNSVNTDANLVGQPAFKAFFFFRQNLVCPSDLGGEYTMVTTYHQHDFIGDGYTENTQNVTIKSLGSGQYEIVGDFSGGLYSVGPYKDAYGTSALTGAKFVDACGKISVPAYSDPWQQFNPDPTRPNSLNPTTKVITISVVGSVYGESWTSVFTPK